MGKRGKETKTGSESGGKLRKTAGVHGQGAEALRVLSAYEKSDHAKREKYDLEKEACEQTKNVHKSE